MSNGDATAAFKPKHHEKSQSHMVSAEKIVNISGRVDNRVPSHVSFEWGTSVISLSILMKLERLMRLACLTSQLKSMKQKQMIVADNRAFLLVSHLLCCRFSF